MRFTSTRVSFSVFAFVLVALFFGAGAPTPLYAVYQDRYGFSDIVLTVIFAVYVLALLFALVFGGRVSDHAGRKPVLLVALSFQLGAMVLFVVADSTAVLLAARMVQGLATGLGMSALSAALLDTEPAERQGLGAAISSAAPLAGLAGGAFGAAVLVQVGPDPRHLVFWVLIAVYAATLVAVAELPEPLPPSGDWRASLRPRIGVPRKLMPAFATITPCITATWALGGLYLSLGPSLTAELTGSSNHVVAALVIVALLGTSAVTSASTRSIEPGRLMVGGASLVIAGVLIAIVAIAARSTAPLFVGSAIAGLGFGPTFAGAFRTLTGMAEAHERAAVVSAIYVVAYPAFSVPAILGGVASTAYGLRDTALVYACTVVVLAGTAVIAFTRQLQRAHSSL